MRRSKFAKVIGIVCMVIVGIMVFSTIVMLLWNNLLPQLFHFPVISFWQALGLLILTKILFGGFRGGGPKHQWKENMRQKWMTMSPEERQRFKEDWGGRCRGSRSGPFGRQGFGERPGPFERTAAPDANPHPEPGPSPENPA